MHNKTVMLIACVSMMFSASVLAEDCKRIENYIMLGKLAGQCNAEVQAKGPGALKTFKPCIGTAKYNSTLGTMNLFMYQWTR
jgi:hypothetical protein